MTECLECDGTGIWEYCEECNENVELCVCTEPDGTYISACDFCDGTGEEDDDGEDDDDD